MLINTSNNQITQITDEQLYGTNYYVNPQNEPIFKIISTFRQYRFENAITAIWNRSFFSILGAAIVYTIQTPLALLYFLIRRKATPKLFTLHWMSIINKALTNPNPFTSLLWTFLLYILTILKSISNFFKMLFWIFKHIIKPFLLPNAVRSLKH